MPAISERDKRTLRLGALALGVIFAVFFGLRGWKAMEARRIQHQDLVVRAQRLKRDLRPYENRLLLAQKLKETYRMEPRNLARASLVAEVSSAIQKAAGTVRVQLGNVRETPARSSNKELASLQLEGTGPVAAIMGLLHRLETLGYPVVVDSLQLNGEPTKPGMIRMSLTIVILDYDQFKAGEGVTRDGASGSISMKKVEAPNA